MKTSVKVENLRCSGCGASIKKGVSELSGVYSVNIDIANKVIDVEHTDEVSREAIVRKLLSMGYPEEGSVEGLSAIKAGAKSVVSCMMGKISG